MSTYVRSLTIRYASGSVLEPHHHSWGQLVYATEGVMTVSTQSGSWVVPSLRAVWIPPETKHWIETSGQVLMQTLYLSPELSAQLSITCRVVYVASLLRELVLHTLDLCPLSSNEPQHQRLTAFLLDQLQTVEIEPLQLPMPKDPRALRVAKDLRQNPADPRTLKKLAKTAAASSRTLERLFHRDTGLTFGMWRQRLRLLEGLRRLAAGDPVTTVALDVGYDSPSAFIYRFKKTFGATPGQYYAEKI